jgi:hypothetical protein
MSMDSSLLPGGRHQGGETYLLEIRALPSSVPPITRLRRVLKSLLRAYDFRAVHARETTPAVEAEAADGGAGVGDR